MTNWRIFKSCAQPGAKKRRARAAWGRTAGAGPLALAMLILAGGSAAAPENGQVFKDWTARCETPEDSDEERCYLIQNLILKEENKRLMGVAVGYLAGNDQPAILVTLPLGVTLPPGVGLQVDEGEGTRFPFERCDQNGCLAGLPLSDEMIGTFKAGSQARVTFLDGRRKQVTLPVSLNGFTAGFGTLR